MRYFVGLFIGVVAISFTAIFIRLSSAPALTIATMRMAVTVLLLLPALAVFERRTAIRITGRDLTLSLLSGVFLAFHFAFWTVSLSYTSVASSLVFLSVHPIFVALLAWAFLHEAPTRAVVMGIVLTVLGSVLIGLNDLRIGGESLFGDGLSLAGAAAIVGYLLIGKSVRARQGFLVYSVLVYVACGLALAVMALGTGTSLLAFNSGDLLIFFALAVATLGGHTVFNWVLKHLPATLVALSFVAEPVGAALLAWLILGEAVSPLTGAGGLAMLAGIYLAARESA